MVQEGPLLKRCKKFYVFEGLLFEPTETFQKIASCCNGSQDKEHVKHQTPVISNMMHACCLYEENRIKEIHEGHIYIYNSICKV